MLNGIAHYKDTMAIRSLTPCGILCLLLLLLATVVRCLTDDQITHLPGLDKQPAFKQYSGYLHAGDGKHFHYWFVESHHSPRHDPMVLWLNGGPGCSSLTGFIEENGPFRVNVTDRTRLTVNEYSWNKIANVLYMESPAGVGFSYSESGNVTTNDDQTCADNVVALKDFFKRYPQFKTHEFYITGESYAGIYVPMLADAILDDSSFNFKGFAVGNGMLDEDIVMNGLMYYVFSHGLIGRSQWNDMTKHCCDGINPNIQRCDYAGQARQNEECFVLVTNAYNTAWNIGINPYNMFARCEGGVPASTTSTWRVGHKTMFSVLTSFLFRTEEEEKLLEKLRKKPDEEIGSGTPCTSDQATTDYLNQASVRRALHIPESANDWAGCSGPVSLRYVKQYRTMRPQFERVMAKDKRISIYNGDSDMACNFIGDEWFVDSLQQPVIEPYKAWYHNNERGEKQVAGFVKQFENINFITVRGSGHFVPKDKPLPAFMLFQKFLDNEPF